MSGQGDKINLTYNLDKGEKKTGKYSSSKSWDSGSSGKIPPQLESKLQQLKDQQKEYKQQISHQESKQQYEAVKEKLKTNQENLAELKDKAKDLNELVQQVEEAYLT